MNTGICKKREERRGRQQNFYRNAVIMLAIFVGACNTVTSAQAEQGQQAAHKAVGTWLVEIDFGPEGPPAFLELLTFHRGGTLSESNSSLNSNSSTVPGSPTALNASDGQGTWRAQNSAAVDFTFYKMVYCSENTPMIIPNAACSPNQLLGFLRVKGAFDIDGDQAVQPDGQTGTQLLAPDMTTVIMDFGAANAKAKRLP